jgi:hypothetical protein
VVLPHFIVNCRLLLKLFTSQSAMNEIDPDRIDKAVLALLFLGRHDGFRTWKSFDRTAMERLHAKGLICDL